MRNNEYTATPNWFKQESTDSLASVYQTNYYLTGSTSSGNGILSPINLYNKYIINTYKLTIDDLFIPNTAIIAVDSELPEGLEPPEDFVSEVGNSVSVQDWHTSYSTRVIAGTTIKANLKSNTFRYGIVFYDEHNTPISGYTPTEDKLVEISVPDTANYFRCCHYIDPESESDSFYIEYQSISIYSEDQINEAYSGVFNDFTSVNSDIQEGITKSSVNSRTLNLIFQQPLQFTTDKAGNIKVELNNDVLKDTLLSTDYVTTIENNPLDVLSLKDFKQGLKINGIEIVEKNGYVLIKGNLATTGGITAYTEDPDDPDGSGGIGGGGTILDIEIKGEGNALINAYLNEDKSILNFDRGYLMDLTTEQTSTALKTFTEGIKVGDTLIKVIDGVLTLDCSLAVTGGIVAYALDEQIASSIMDAIICDNTTIAVIDGKLTVIGGTGGASNWDELEGKPSWITDTKPTYTWSEITNKPNTLYDYGIQASDVLNTIKSVDGSGSGLDADTLDGKHYTDIINGNVASATKLQTARTIWGQSFDGTANITGSLTSVTDITGTGTFTGANIKATDSVYVNGIRLHKTVDGAVTIEGNLLVTGGITAYADGEDSGGTGGGVIVIDNLTSTLTDAALSANQGRVLKGLIDSKVSNWGELEGKPTTIAGYGITDAYTKTECDDRYVNVSGDTMAGNLIFPLSASIIQKQSSTPNYTSAIKWYKGGNSQDTYDPQIGQYNIGGDGYGSICILPYATSTSPWGGSVGLFIGKNILKIDNQTVWNEGNDGTDSGLDADMLDGIHLNGIFTELSSSSGTNLSATIGGITKNIADLYATTAEKLTTNAGANNRPVYFANGIPVAGTYTFGNASGNAAINNGTLCTNLNADMLDGWNIYNIIKKYKYTIPTSGNKGVRISYETNTPIMICVSRNNINARLILFGAGYGAGGTTRNNWNAIVNTGLYQWSIPQSDDIIRSVDILSGGTSQDNVEVWSTGNISFIPISELYSPAYESIPINSGNIGYYNAGSATKLQTARTLWGQSFNGTANVSGDMTGVGSISATGNIVINSSTTLKLSGGGISYCYSGNYAREFGQANENGDMIWVIAGIYSLADNNTVRSYYGGTYDNPVISILPNRNVGIGTTSPSEKLHVSGNILSTGGGTFYSSDVRAKTIIERPKLSLNSIANAPVIKFRWNGYNGLKDDNKQHVGGVAQYIEKILPECVIGQKDDFLSFDYATVGYVFSVQTARYLQSYETKTDREIKKLKNRITFLEKQLKKLGYEEIDIVAD